MAVGFLDNSQFPNRGKAVFVVTTVTFVLATIFVFARLVSRFAIVRRRSLDDYFIILSWVSLTC